MTMNIIKEDLLSIILKSRLIFLKFADQLDSIIEQDRLIDEKEILRLCRAS